MLEIPMGDPVRLLVAALAVASSMAAQTHEAAAARTGEGDVERTSAEERGVREVVERWLAAIRRGAGGERLAVQENGPAKTLQRRAQEIRELLRAPAEPPLSELSPPVALVRAVSFGSAGRATACIAVLRLGPVQQLRLATFEAGLVRMKHEWRLAQLSAEGSCRDPAEDLWPASEVAPLFKRSPDPGDGKR